MVQAGLPWQLGGTASAPFPRLGTRSIRMIHMYGYHMSSLCLTLKGWSLWGLG